MKLIHYSLALLAAGALLLAPPARALDVLTKTDLGQDLTLSSWAYDINGSGQVAGCYELNAPNWDDDWSQLFLWLPAPAYGLGAGRHSINVMNPDFILINSSGQVAGNQYIDGSALHPTLFVWLPENAFGLAAGAYPIAAPAGYPSYNLETVEAINASGQIAGNVWLHDSGKDKAFLWQPGADAGNANPWTELPIPNGFVGSYTMGMNDAGQVIGFCTPATGGDIGCVWNGIDQPVLLDAGVYPYAINNAGQVVGQMWIGRFEAFIWNGATSPTSLHNQLGAGYSWSRASGINQSGQVAILAGHADGTAHVFVWDPIDGATDLGALPSAYVLEKHPKINASGLIMVTTQSSSRGLLGSTVFGLLDVGTLGGAYAQLVGFNDANQAVGCSEMPSGRSHALLVTLNTTDIHRPVLTVPASPFEVYWNDPKSFTVTATDADGADSLTFSLVQPPSWASIAPAGDPRAAVVTVTPDSVGGLVDVRIQVTDPVGLTDTKTVAIHSSWPPIVLSGVPEAATIDEEQGYGFTTTISGGTGNYNLQVEPSNSGAWFNSGQFYWRPSEAHGPGQYTFTLTVTDFIADNQSDSKQITITVNEVNQPPVLSEGMFFTGKIGTPVTFTAAAQDPDDPANTLTYSLEGDPGSATITENGNFTWTPTATGTFTFQVTVSDGQDSDTETVTIYVLQPPAITVNTVARKGRAITVAAAVKNIGSQIANNVQITSASLDNGTLTTRLPLTITRTLKVGASNAFSLKFDAATTQTGQQILTIAGTSSTGPFSITQTVTVP